MARGLARPWWRSRLWEGTVAELRLAELVARGAARHVVGDASVRIAGVKHDSRRCVLGDLFVAIPDGPRDGSAFVQDAVGRGAVAVLAEREHAVSVPLVIADDALVSLAAIARDVYEDPTSQLRAVGITGTNGKTTVTYLLEAMVKAAEGKPAVIGTVNFRGPFGELPATHTTPMADDLMRLSRLAVQSGATHLLLEVSSHALAMHRADGVRFSVAAFTNLTQDHLDYHGDLDSYARAKLRLFADLSSEHAVINIDDPASGPFVAAAKGKLWRCSKHASSGAEVRASEVSLDRRGIRARIDTPLGSLRLESPLVGEHNLENLLVAIGCGAALGLPLEVMASALRHAQGAPGRLERVPHPDDVLVFVDYAHTPDALARVLTTLRASTEGRLLVVFGCGGDRDPGKRPRMGEEAARLADVVVVTSDNPRSEAPNAIAEQIVVGVRRERADELPVAALAAAARGFHVELDRRSAIAAALLAAKRGDTVLIAGKGHEKVQIVADQKLPFDDVQEAARAIAARRSAG